jgi:hypothetical protein
MVLFARKPVICIDHKHTGCTISNSVNRRLESRPIHIGPGAGILEYACHGKVVVGAELETARLLVCPV